MRQFLFVLVTTLYLYPAHILAQETQQQETAALDAVTKWKIVNTVIFLIGLGWLIAKYAPAFFNARSSDIQKAINDATGLKMQADLRYSEIDRRMAGLSDEVKRMREEAAVVMQRDHEKFQRETEGELDHIRQNVSAEVEALQKEGIRHIRRHTAKLALQVAERKLHDRVTGLEPEEMVQDFVHLVERDRN